MLNDLVETYAIAFLLSISVISIFCLNNNSAVLKMAFSFGNY